jgi:hypothetical protein
MAETKVHASVVGPGAARFLTVSLRDALDAGIALLAIQRGTSSKVGARYAVDFIFASDDSSSDEVIRAGLDGEAQVHSAELTRCPKLHVRDGLPAEALRTLLAGGAHIQSLAWDPAENGKIVLSVATRQSLSIPAG